MEKIIDSALYEEKSGLLQRTLKNNVTVSVLFGEIGEVRNGKKGTYVDLPSSKDMVGVVLPFVIDGEFKSSGIIKINDYCDSIETKNNAATEGKNYVVGSFNVTLQVGRTKLTKNLKTHDLATLWCLATDCNRVAMKEYDRLKKKAMRTAMKTA